MTRDVRHDGLVFVSLTSNGPVLLDLTSRKWLFFGYICLQQAQRSLDEKWICIADFTIQTGSKKALIVLRVPVSALTTGQAVTLKQAESSESPLPGNLFNMAIAWGKASENPMQKVRFARENNQYIRFLSVDEEERLLPVYNDWLRPLVIPP